jgi:hypothetical protein
MRAHGEEWSLSAWCVSLQRILAIAAGHGSRSLRPHTEPNIQRSKQVAPVKLSIMRQQGEAPHDMLNERPTTEKLWALLVVVAVLAVMGLITTAHGARIILRAYRSSVWLPVEATINAPPRDSDNGAQSLLIKYDYVVKDVKYSSSWKHLGIKSQGANHHFKLINEYGVGKHLTAYYDPKDPGSSTMRPSLHLDMGMPLLLGLFILAFSIVGFSVYLKELATMRKISDY